MTDVAGGEGDLSGIPPDQPAVQTEEGQAEAVVRSIEEFSDIRFHPDSIKSLYDIFKAPHAGQKEYLLKSKLPSNTTEEGYGIPPFMWEVFSTGKLARYPFYTAVMDLFLNVVKTDNPPEHIKFLCDAVYEGVTGKIDEGLPVGLWPSIDDGRAWTMYTLGLTRNAGYDQNSPLIVWNQPESNLKQKETQVRDNAVVYDIFKDEIIKTTDVKVLIEPESALLYCEWLLQFDAFVSSIENQELVGTYSVDLTQMDNDTLFELGIDFIRLMLKVTLGPFAKDFTFTKSSFKSFVDETGRSQLINLVKQNFIFPNPSSFARKQVGANHFTLSMAIFFVNLWFKKHWFFNAMGMQSTYSTAMFQSICQLLFLHEVMPDHSPRLTLALGNEAEALQIQANGENKRFGYKPSTGVLSAFQRSFLEWEKGVISAFMKKVISSDRFLTDFVAQQNRTHLGLVNWIGDHLVKKKFLIFPTEKSADINQRLGSFRNTIQKASTLGGFFMWVILFNKTGLSGKLQYSTFSIHSYIGQPLPDSAIIPLSDSTPVDPSKTSSSSFEDIVRQTNEKLSSMSTDQTNNSAEVQRLYDQIYRAFETLAQDPSQLDSVAQFNLNQFPNYASRNPNSEIQSAYLTIFNNFIEKMSAVREKVKQQLMDNVNNSVEASQPDYPASTTETAAPTVTPATTTQSEYLQPYDTSASSNASLMSTNYGTSYPSASGDFTTPSNTPSASKDFDAGATASSSKTAFTPSSSSTTDQEQQQILLAQQQAQVEQEAAQKVEQQKAEMFQQQQQQLQQQQQVQQQVQQQLAQPVSQFMSAITSIGESIKELRNTSQPMDAQKNFDMILSEEQRLIRAGLTELNAKVSQLASAANFGGYTENSRELLTAVQGLSQTIQTQLSKTDDMESTSAYETLQKELQATMEQVIKLRAESDLMKNKFTDPHEVELMKDSQRHYQEQIYEKDQRIADLQRQLNDMEVNFQSFRAQYEKLTHERAAEMSGALNVHDPNSVFHTVGQYQQQQLDLINELSRNSSMYQVELNQKRAEVDKFTREIDALKNTLVVVNSKAAAAANDYASYEKFMTTYVYNLTKGTEIDKADLVHAEGKLKTATGQIASQDAYLATLQQQFAELGQQHMQFMTEASEKAKALSKENFDQTTSHQITIYENKEMLKAFNKVASDFRSVIAQMSNAELINFPTVESVETTFSPALNVAKNAKKSFDTNGGYSSLKDAYNSLKDVLNQYVENANDMISVLKKSVGDFLARKSQDEEMQKEMKEAKVESIKADTSIKLSTANVSNTMTSAKTDALNADVEMKQATTEVKNQKGDLANMQSMMVLLGMMAGLGGLPPNLQTSVATELLDDTAEGTAEKKQPATFSQLGNIINMMNGMKSQLKASKQKQFQKFIDVATALKSLQPQGTPTAQASLNANGEQTNFTGVDLNPMVYGARMGYYNGYIPKTALQRTNLANGINYGTSSVYGAAELLLKQSEEMDNLVQKRVRSMVALSKTLFNGKKGWHRIKDMGILGDDSEEDEDDDEDEDEEKEPKQKKVKWESQEEDQVDEKKNFQKVWQL